MSRLLFQKGKQKKFFDAVIAKSGLPVEELAKKCGRSSRTIRDWRKEKFNPDTGTINNLSKEFSVNVNGVKEVDTFWYVHKGARKGALKCIELYGPPGTPEGRSKGGRVSQEKRKSDPEKYKELGCIVRKDFNSLGHSEGVAELCGVLLGDGGITNYQITVSLDRVTDREYVDFVSGLIHELIGEKPSLNPRQRVMNIRVSGANLVEALEGMGLVRGDKIVNQVRIPQWIRDNKKYARACVRGLFDTDGSLYRHRKIQRTYMGWNFVSMSLPLLTDVATILSEHGIQAKHPKKGSLYLYNKKDISRYMELFNSHNPKHVRKFEKYMEGCAEW